MIKSLKALEVTCQQTKLREELNEFTLKCKFKRAYICRKLAQIFSIIHRKHPLATFGNNEKRSEIFTQDSYEMFRSPCSFYWQ